MPSEELRKLAAKVRLMERENNFMKQALRDIRDHDEDASWTYEILQFIASEALKFNKQVEEQAAKQE